MCPPQPYDPDLDAFDVYVDGIRFPPDCLLAVRVVARAVSSSFNSILEPFAALSTLDSDRFLHPLGPLYADYRKGPCDPTAMLLFRHAPTAMLLFTTATLTVKAVNAALHSDAAHAKLSIRSVVFINLCFCLPACICDRRP